ncbi:uroporphyrinogen-III C-methyltransferase [Pandoraea capi]|uniref:uroporphyrinogen-III C-methyltransferase n=2 Tax=Pandoraea capi TaxID=2508286 RepID=A0ABY6VLL7_9BURK|nr:uroporphyrinogen-III C-methyltransferase [Pandoraea capi]VVD60236.1 uroporphyrinogen-III C-methyltransferase [Pandoraea capi]
MSRAWLIGAGPGDPELITVKAMRALGQADVVLVDDLVNPGILAMAAPHAQIVYVGKRGGHASTPQREIIALMLSHLRAGRSVARLKGGDPFVFGRGGEELQALQAAGVPVEILGGITAGIAAPTTLGIPVTHRGLAQGVIFVTGHSAGEDEPDWRALAATGLTLVIYMGIRRLQDITDQLQQAGMSPDTPCAAIESATLPAQRHVIATLHTLSAEVRAAAIGSPSIIVIGDVVSLAQRPGMIDGDDAGSEIAGISRRPTAQRPLSLGIGFRQGVTTAQIEAAVLAALGARSLAEVATLATLDKKASDPALVRFCERHGICLAGYAPAQIDACLDAHPQLSRSDTVLAHVGVRAVCEPCALLASSGGTLLAKKYADDGITVAIAETTTIAASDNPQHDAQPESRNDEDR